MASPPSRRAGRRRPWLLRPGAPSPRLRISRQPRETKGPVSSRRCHGSHESCVRSLVDPRGWVRLHADEHVSEVVDRVHAVRLGGRDERVEAGEVLAWLVSPDEGALTRGYSVLAARWPNPRDSKAFRRHGGLGVTPV
jgi:hypothetical protein